MTPFMKAISQLTKPEQLAAYKLLDMADERGFVNLSWEDAFNVFGCKSRGRVRAMLSHIKSTNILHGNTSSMVNIMFTGFHNTRESFQNMKASSQNTRESFQNDSPPDLDGFQNTRESFQNMKASSQNTRAGGGKGGEDRYIHRVNRLIQKNSLNEADLSIYLSSEDQKRTVAMLTDQAIAMPQMAAEIAAIVTDPDRAVSVTANWLAEIELGQNHTAIGLLARLTDRNERGNYKFPAKAIPSEFYRSDFAKRHGLSFPDAKESSGYEVPDEFAGIFIG